MLRRTPVLVTAAAVAVAGTLASCDGDSDGDSLTDLESALAAVPATDENLTLIAWTNISAAVVLGAYEEYPNPFATAGLIGYGGLATAVRQFDPALLPATDTDGSAVVSMGRPPDTAFRIDGVDAAAVDEFFAGADGNESELADGTLLVRREDYAMDPSDDRLPSTVLAQMNTVWFGDSTLIGSSTQPHATSLVQGEGESAADAAVYAGITDCLGEVLAAELHSGEASSIGVAYGLGYDGTAEDPEVRLCLHADDPEDMAETIRDSLSSGLEPSVQRPWSDVLGPAEVEVSGDWVQLRLTDPEPADALYQVVQSQTLSALLGEDIPTRG
ncbi:hypothetical protein [Ruania albidiflava]|uniref:hypothetical protein n=1 Tax=Ruania albidiflava TaxID=366586 RepID=UPI0003B35579|nr:hypothetical protein [Ruania albidiflava]